MGKIDLEVMRLRMWSEKKKEEIRDSEKLTNKEELGEKR